MRFILCLFLFYSSYALAVLQLNSNEDKQALFSGRISRINTNAGLIRLRVDFENMKFVNRKDRIEFWNESYPENRCVSYVEGRSTRYILLKVPSFKDCVQKVGFTTGTYLHLYSDDLAKSLDTAGELVDILLKKRLALQARESRFRKEVDGFVEKIDVVNKRYEILRQKLELEWQKELSALEEDKSRTHMLYKHTQARLNEVENKLHQYRVEDQNLKLDRWSLDPALYFKK